MTDRERANRKEEKGREFEIKARSETGRKTDRLQRQREGEGGRTSKTEVGKEKRGWEKECVRKEERGREKESSRDRVKIEWLGGGGGGE